MAQSESGEIVYVPLACFCRKLADAGLCESGNRRKNFRQWRFIQLFLEVHDSTLFSRNTFSKSPGKGSTYCGCFPLLFPLFPLTLRSWLLKYPCRDVHSIPCHASAILCVSVHTMDESAPIMQFSSAAARASQAHAGFLRQLPVFSVFPTPPLRRAARHARERANESLRDSAVQSFLPGRRTGPLRVEKRYPLRRSFLQALGISPTHGYSHTLPEDSWLAGAPGGKRLGRPLK